MSKAEFYLQIIRKQFHYVLFAIFVLVYLFKLNTICTEYSRYDKVINEDAFGYYVILPAIFQYKDAEFAFLDSVLNKTEKYSSYIPPVINRVENNQRVCKYYSGVALLQTPFYLVAWQISKSRNDENGFGKIYQRAILIASAFYLMLGFFFLLQILIRIGLHPVAAAFSLPILLFGTNLYAYSTYDIGYSHVYSFFALSVLIYSLLRLKSSGNLKFAAISGLFYAIVIIIRPLNGIAILFLPILFNFSELRNSIRLKYSAHMVVAIVCFVAIISIQSILWYWQTERFWVYPYTNEKLNLADPKMIELIFGFNCGWAMYTPLAFFLLCLSILLLVIQKKIRIAIWTFMSAFAILYLLSSWYYLHYGCTLGCRPITEFYAPLLIIFAYAIRPYISKLWFHLSISPIIILLFFYNLIIHYQFFNNIINPCEMDKQRFSMVFLKTNETYHYSCFPFWDFSRFDYNAIAYSKSMNKTLRIGKQSQNSQFKLQLTGIDNKDSVLLFNIRMRGKMKAIDGSFLRILITEEEHYIDLLNLLLRRKIQSKNSEEEFVYQFHISKQIRSPEFHFSLESADGNSDTELLLQSIEIKRVKL